MIKPIRVALLGATSHIAKGLIACWLNRQEFDLFLYARSPERVQEFMEYLGTSSRNVFLIHEFGKEQYDVVVNCVGIGSPQKLRDNLDDIFRITSSIDDMILDYLVSHAQTLYINLSSGAAFGADFSRPVDELSQAKFNVNNLKPEEFYGISKLHSEAKHRALSKLNIVDLRIYGYFSRYIDLNEKFLLSEIITCLKHNQTLITGQDDIWRDFLHPHDLVSLIELCITHCPLNSAYDVYSCKEVSKFELLEFFMTNYGLKYKVDESYQFISTTGKKSHYFPVCRNGLGIGYVPTLTSLEGVKLEVSAILAEG